jgi:hypothetical protein
MDSDQTRPVASRQGRVLGLAVLLGLTLGWLAARPLSGLAAGNLGLWAVAVVALGTTYGTAPGKAIRLGAFGFAVGFSFMCFGYSGAEPLATRLLPFALIGVFCGGCAIALGALVHLVLSARAARSAAGERGRDGDG